MATNSTATKYTISDIIQSYSSMDGNAAYIKVANVLSLKCPLFRMLPMQASNQLMSDISSKITSMGSPSLRRFNEYVASTKNQRTPLTEPIAMFQDWSEVDSSLYKVQNDPIQWRMDEDAVKVESMTQSVEDQFLNGNIATYPSGINGFFTRYKLSTARPNGVTSTRYNVQLAGGSGSDVTSVLVLELGANKVFGIYPKNTRAGINLVNKGEQTVYDSNGKKMDAMVTKIELYFGLVVRDDRYVQRIANIEVSGSSSLLDPAQLSSALRRLPGGGSAPGTCILCSPTVMDQFDQMAMDKTNVRYEPDNVWGGQQTQFMRVPIFVADKISEAQTAIS